MAKAAARLQDIRARIEAQRKKGRTPVRIFMPQSVWEDLKAEFVVLKSWRDDAVTGKDVFGMPVDRRRRHPSIAIVYDGGFEDVVFLT